MAITVEDFAKEFFQEIIDEADAAGTYTETIFFEKFCTFLADAGELDTADRAYYLGPPQSGIRVDGYGGDPAESLGTLSLIIADFNQAQGLGSLTQTELNKIFPRLEKFLRRALQSEWRNRLEESSPAFGLADLIATRWNGITHVRMLVISNRKLSDRVDGRKADEVDGRTVTYNVWDIGRLHRFATEKHGREEIEIDLEAEFGGVLPLLPAHLATEDYEAYLTVLPGPMLAEIYDRWGARLLEQNVRVFLQARGNVNRGIRNTLESDPSMFFAYNNGVTATAEGVKTEEREGKLVLTRLRNLQIVNGGQTTASIHAAMRKKYDLSAVFVQMKLSIVDKESVEKVVPKISEYANSQNRVNAADFFANHPFHIRMEDFSRRKRAPSPDGTFRETKWFYERARGQFNDARSNLSTAERRIFDRENPRSQLFSKTDLAKYLNVWDLKPHVVSLGAQKNFADFAKSVGKAWNSNENNFNEGFFEEAVAKAIVFKRTEKIVSEQEWYEGGYRANIVAYAIAKMAHDVATKNRSVDFRKIWNAQRISAEMEHALAIVAWIVHDCLIDPPPGIRNVTEYAKKPGCWVRIQHAEVEWPDGFLRELISCEQNHEQQREDRQNQRILNGIEAQIAVVKAGGDFWRQIRTWGLERDLLSEKDDGVLAAAASGNPSEKQSQLIMKILARLRQEGFRVEMPS